MKKYILMAAFLSAATFITSCSEDDIDSPVKRPTAYTGDEVQFSIEGKRSRTMYQSNWNATNTQELYWGNYNSEVGDSIKIYCFQGARQIATYSVQPQATNNSVADGIAKTGAYGIQWGSESEQHQFYAFYPAMYGGDQFVDNNPGKIRAKVDVGQSPVSYVAYSTTDTELQTVKYNGLPDINANRTVSADNSVVICCQPDMKQAIMVARNTTAKYGDVVGLRFNVLADVLDISINGPVEPNTLGGNADDGEKAKRKYIQIHNVRVESKSASNPQLISNDIAGLRLLAEED